MHRAEHQRGRRAIAQQLFAKDARRAGGDLRIGEGLLGDERVALEPVEQILCLRADDAGLDVMDMRVDEAGRDQAAAVVGDARVRLQQRLDRGDRTGRDDDAVAAEHEAIGLVTKRRRRIGEEWVVAAEDE